MVSKSDGNKSVGLSEKMSAVEERVEGLERQVNEVAEELRRSSNETWKEIRAGAEITNVKINETWKEIRAASEVTNAKIADLARAVSETKTISWPLIVSIAMGVVTVSSLLGSFLWIMQALSLKPIELQTNSVEKRIEKIETWVIDHAITNAQQMEKIGGLERDLFKRMQVEAIPGK